MKEKITVCFILITLFTFPILSFLKEKETISYTERRMLEELKKEDLLNFPKWEKYLVDHFIGREELKELKGFVSLNILRKKENKNTVEVDQNLFDLNTTINEKSIIHITNLINKIKEKYIKTENIYYSIIPDKNYYLEETKLPKMNYEKLQKLIKENLNSSISYINIMNDLDLNSYYKTDIHWKQTELLKVKETLLGSLKNNNSKNNYERKTNFPFYGVLKSRIANNIKPETIEYFWNEEMENATVYNYEKKEYEKIYKENYKELLDGYDMFLGGATPILIIENKNAQTSKELILFRDSFGSSLAPLLIEAYQKITLIDLRYISSSFLENIKEIQWKEDEDILFLYSIPIINNSFTNK